MMQADELVSGCIDQGQKRLRLECKWPRKMCGRICRSGWHAPPHLAFRPEQDDRLDRAAPRGVAGGLGRRPLRHCARVDQHGGQADERIIAQLADALQSLLGHAARLQEVREVGARPQSWNTQFHSAGARLSVAVAVAVAVTLGCPERRLFAIGGAGCSAHLHLHPLLGGEADNLAQQSASEVFSTSVRRFIMASVIGGLSSSGLVLTTRPSRKAPDDQR